MKNNVFNAGAAFMKKCKKTGVDKILVLYLQIHMYLKFVLTYKLFFI